jgi:hypothetical protein
MPKPIPLRATLRIERQRIIIHGPGALVEDIMLERRAVEARHPRPVQRPVRRDPDPVLDLPRRRERVRRRQAVQHPQLVRGPEEAPRVTARTVLLERQSREGGW